MSPKFTAPPGEMENMPELRVLRSIDAQVDATGFFTVIALNGDDGEAMQYLLPYPDFGWFQHDIEHARRIATLRQREQDRGGAAMEALIAAALRPNVSATYVRTDQKTGDTTCIFQFPRRGALPLLFKQDEVEALIDLQARVRRNTLA